VTDATVCLIIYETFGDVYKRDVLYIARLENMYTDQI